jgi:hypothetical protein
MLVDVAGAEKEALERDKESAEGKIAQLIE